MGQVGSVIVGADSSACSRAALAEGARLAARRGAALHVAHVIDRHVLDDLSEATGQTREQIERDATEAAMERVRDLLSAAGEHARGAQTHALVGEPLKELLRLGKKVGATLYVAGVRGDGTMGSGVGSVALGLARKAEGMVLVVQEGHYGAYGKVAALVDFSETSKLAMREAARVAKGDGAGLDVVHAYSPPWEKLHYRAPTPEAKPDYQREYRGMLTDRLGVLAEEAGGEYGGKATVRLVECGSVAEGVVKDLLEQNVELAVLGSRGRSTLRAMLLGSVAERILQEAHCSVLTVKPAGFRFEAE